MSNTDPFQPNSAPRESLPSLEDAPDAETAVARVWQGVLTGAIATPPKDSFRDRRWRGQRDLTPDLAAAFGSALSGLLHEPLPDAPEPGEQDTRLWNGELVFNVQSNREFGASYRSPVLEEAARRAGFPDDLLDNLTAGMEISVGVGVNESGAPTVVLTHLRPSDDRPGEWEAARTYHMWPVEQSQSAD